MRLTSSSIPVDQSLEDAAKEWPGEPIRIRIQPSILRHPEGKSGAVYQAWRKLHYMLEVDTVEEGRAFREAMSAFFYVASQQGIMAVHGKLVEMLPGEKGVALDTPVMTG